jgi:hypothetical protein
VLGSASELPLRLLNIRAKELILQRRVFVGRLDVEADTVVNSGVVEMLGPVKLMVGIWRNDGVLIGRGGGVLSIGKQFEDGVPSVILLNSFDVAVPRDVLIRGLVALYSPSGLRPAATGEGPIRSLEVAPNGQLYIGGLQSSEDVLGVDELRNYGILGLQDTQLRVGQYIEGEGSTILCDTAAIRSDQGQYEGGRFVGAFPSMGSILAQRGDTIEHLVAGNPRMPGLQAPVPPASNPLASGWGVGCEEGQEEESEESGD